MARAVERGRRDRLLDDPFAEAFLRAPSRLLATRAAVPPWLDLGFSSAIAARHAWIDARLGEVVGDVAQVLILGAGYDSRAWRLDLGGLPVAELDHPATAARKARRLRAIGLDPARVQTMVADLADVPLGRVLAEGPLPAGKATAVVWEGVSMYLPPDAVAATLRALHDWVAPGSPLLLDLWRPSASPVVVAGRLGLAVLGEPLRFGLPTAEVAGFLRACGWDVRAHTDVYAEAERHGRPRSWLDLQLVHAVRAPRPPVSPTGDAATR